MEPSRSRWRLARSPSRGPLAEEGDLEEIDTEGSLAIDEASIPPLAIVEDETGSVVWLPPEHDGDLPEVVITIIGANAPINHPDEIDDHGPVVGYLLASGEDRVPEPLQPFVRDEATRAVLETEGRLETLRAESKALHDRIQAENDAADDGLPPLASETCSSAERTAARNAYGAAYTSSKSSGGWKSCGQSVNWYQASGTRFWCNNGADCDHGLPTNSCEVNNNCTSVRGITTSFRARLSTSPSTFSSFQHFGRRYRFGYYNCSPTFTAQFERQRGSGSVITTNVSPGTMKIRVGGQSAPHKVALVGSVGLGGNTWKEDRSWDSSSEAPMNRMEMTVPTFGFMCGDLIQRFRTEESSNPSCNGTNRLCEYTCTGFGNCFESSARLGPDVETWAA